MVYISTSEEWQRQSALLLQAQPTTTRITTKYKIPNLDSPKYQNSKKRKRATDAAEDKEDAPKVPRAVLVLKTYDPTSGVCLKLKTDKAAEVSRLIIGLGRLGRHMAAMPEKIEAPDATMDDAPDAADVKAAAPEGVEAKAPQAPAAGGGGGGKKKKKGKK